MAGILERIDYGLNAHREGNQQVKKGELIVLNLNCYIKENGRFLGWSTTSDGEVVYEDGSTFTISDNSFMNCLIV